MTNIFRSRYIMQLKQYTNNSWPRVQNQTLHSYENYIQYISLGAKTSQMMHDLIQYTQYNWRLHDVDEMFYRICRTNHINPVATSVEKSMYINPNHVVSHGLPYWDVSLKNISILGTDACTFKNGATIEIATTTNINENSNANSHITRITKEACEHAALSVSAPVDLIQKYADENGYFNYRVQTTTIKDLPPNSIYTIEAIFINETTPLISKMPDGSYATSSTLFSTHFKHTVLLEHPNTPRILTRTI